MSEVVECDVIVVGSGAGGLAAAVTAAKGGLKVIVLEKEALYGGTTARSGGVLWIPCNPNSQDLSIDDSEDQARCYLRHQAGRHYDEQRVDAFLANGPRMVRFFESETAVKFDAIPEFPDYHSDVPGGKARGRSIVAAPYDAGALGLEARRLRPPLREITFVGMMFNASQEVTHFFNITRSLTSAAYVVRRLLQHSLEMLRHGRAQRLTSGNALIARLARSAFDAGVEIRTRAGVQRLLMEDGRVGGIEWMANGRPERLHARRGVVLATGGFPQDPELRRRLFPHAQHHSPGAPGNTGDGWRLAQAAGGQTVGTLPNNAAWIPVSLVPRRQGPCGVFPHLLDRYKPGIIAVDPSGRRFTNEADSYHDFGQAMQAACTHRGETYAWLVTDHRAIRRYGMGYAKPFPLPLWPHLRSGYLKRGRTPAKLAIRLGIDPATFARTLDDYNHAARDGLDPAFGKGSTPYNRYLGDSNHLPNPCIAPLDRGPYYAVKLLMGDLGTFAGIRTDSRARVVGADGAPVPGLFAVGNDASSVMGGSYPGAGITLGPAMTFGYIAGRHLVGQGHAMRDTARQARSVVPEDKAENQLEGDIA